MCSFLNYDQKGLIFERFEKLELTKFTFDLINNRCKEMRKDKSSRQYRNWYQWMGEFPVVIGKYFVHFSVLQSIGPK